MRQNYKYLLITILFFAIVSACLSAQNNKGNFKISVVFVDPQGNPVNQAVIKSELGKTIAKSDAFGKIDFDHDKDEKLNIHAEGFEPMQIGAEEMSSFEKIELVKKPFHMDFGSEIHIPFGKTTKREIVGAVSVLNIKDISGYDNNLDVSTAINGRVPGMMGSNNIRGLKHPLIVIDGISQSVGGTSQTEILKALSLMEVEQITVLKDAVSSVLYGAQADQGVILITTKRGTPFHRVRNVVAEYGFSDPISYPGYLNASDYMTLYNEALTNDDKLPLYTQEEIVNTRSGTDPVRYPDVDYYNSSYLKNYAGFYKIKMEASGGNQVMGYYTNLGWNHNGSPYNLGDAKNARDNRINFRGNVDYGINDWLSASLDAVAILGINSGPNGDPSNNWRGNFWESTTQLFPNYFPTLIPSSLILDSAISSTAIYVDGDKILGGTNQYRNNIYGNFTRAGFQRMNELLLNTSTGLDFNFNKIIKGLTGKVFVSYNISSNYILRQDNSYAVYEPSYVDSYLGIQDSLVLVKYGNDVKVDNQSINYPDAMRKLGAYATLHYEKLIQEKHYVSVTGVSYFNKFNIMNSLYSQKNQHVGLRAEYMFNNRFIAEFVGAYVGSGKLSSGNRYKLSPGIGAAWVLSEEGFLSGSYINYLKIKANYGSLVTDRYLGYQYFEDSYITTGSFLYNQSSGNGNSVKSFDITGNSNISMSRRNILNTGFESSFLNDKIWVEANFFNSRSVGQPVRRTYYYPGHLGGVLPYENYEEYQETGYDLGMSYNDKVGNFAFNVAANVTYSLPKSLLVDEIQFQILGLPERLLQGKPYDAIFGYIAEGLFADNLDIDSHAVQTFGTVKPGDIKYKDVTGDGRIDEDDQVQIGNSGSRYQFDLNISLEYKNLSIFVLGTGQTGGDVIFNDPYYWVYGNDRKYSEVVMGRWTENNAQNATYPRLTSGDGSNNFRNSTYWIRDNHWFRIHSLQLSYSLKERSGVLNGLKVYLRGSNLKTFSKISDELDLNIGSAPNTRNFAIGLILAL